MYYIDDPDQLPELPDPGPRDGRHGVDRDTEFNPYPPVHFGPDTGGDLAVSVPDAKWHLDFLLDRVQAGEEIVVMRHGHPVAMLVQPRRRRRVAHAVSTSLSTSLSGSLRSARIRSSGPAGGSMRADSISVSETVVDTVSVADAADGTVETVTTSRSRTKSRTKVFPDEGDQLPELPDPGPRDGRHGVDSEDDDKPLFFPLSR
ncbi:type II toxin-antitoxin system Phd/YefM family antitoxin [Glaciibacter sp. 2TAF33]|uniref:type II toxin-antitoxin system Phd/YefM family antitoxin n=1 Tax=Glaciibacter sp. 2TAF33 TaxID=3233015 RepID=UPI003F8DDFE2